MKRLLGIMLVFALLFSGAYGENYEDDFGISVVEFSSYVADLLSQDPDMFIAGYGFINGIIPGNYHTKNDNVIRPGHAFPYEISIGINPATRNICMIELLIKHNGSSERIESFEALWDSIMALIDAQERYKEVRELLNVDNGTQGGTFRRTASIDTLEFYFESDEDSLMLEVSVENTGDILAHISEYELNEGSIKTLYEAMIEASGLEGYSLPNDEAVILKNSEYAKSRYATLSFRNGTGGEGILRMNSREREAIGNQYRNNAQAYFLYDQPESAAAVYRYKNVNLICPVDADLDEQLALYRGLVIAWDEIYGNN